MNKQPQSEYQVYGKSLTLKDLIKTSKAKRRVRAFYGNIENMESITFDIDEVERVLTAEYKKVPDSVHDGLIDRMKLVYYIVLKNSQWMKFSCGVQLPEKPSVVAKYFDNLNKRIQKIQNEG